MHQRKRIDVALFPAPPASRILAPKSDTSSHSSWRLFLRLRALGLSSIMLGLSAVVGCNNPAATSPDAGTSTAGAQSDIGAQTGTPVAGDNNGLAGASNPVAPPQPQNPPPVMPTGAESPGSLVGAADQVQLGGLKVEPSLPSSGVGRAPEFDLAQLPPDLAELSFMKLKPPAEDLAAVSRFFAEADRALQELALTMRTQKLSDAQWSAIAKRVSSMKLEAGKTMQRLAGNDPKTLKAGIAAEVEALSHLTGLGDVDAAKKLQARGEELCKLPDPELSHQGNLVVFGFRLNQLQEGQLKDPRTLLTDIDGLFKRPEDRGVVELMALQQCAVVLDQLGYKNESKAVAERIDTEFRDSADPRLSMAAWQMKTNGSTSLASFQQAVKEVSEGSQPDYHLPAQTAATLIGEFPSPNTLQTVATQIVQLEYSGKLNASDELAGLIAKQPQQNWGRFSQEISGILAAHSARIQLLDKPLDLSGAIPADGVPFDLQAYRGKVVVVTCWASWCINCLNEMPELRQLYADLHGRGLEVIGVNMDENATDADMRIEKERFPWRTLRAGPPEAAGFESPLAKRLGITAIPFVAVLDREGRVVQIHQRGKDLRNVVERLLAVTPASN